MKSVFLSLILLITCQQVSAQLDIDSLVTDFSTNHQLYNRKLKKLEAIRLKVSASRGEKSEWEKLYNEWIENSRNSLDVETLLVNHFNLENRDKIPYGYSLEYLTYRVDRCIDQKKISKKNGAVLKNILTGELNDVLLKDEIKQIESSIQLFTSQKDHNPNSLVEFIREHSNSIDLSNSYSVFREIMGYTEVDWSTFSQDMIKLGVKMDDLSESFPRVEKNSLSTCSMSFLSLLQNPSAIATLTEDDFFMYKAYLENSIVREFFFSSMLFSKWKNNELAVLDKREYAKRMELSQKESPSRLFIHLDYGFKYTLKRFGIGDTSQCLLEQLLVLAYNDIYFNMRPNTSVKFRRAKTRVDFADFDLTDDERTIINGILSSEKMVTEYHLKNAVSNDLLPTLNWNLEFRLACYIALYYKSIDQSRDWNMESYVLNPFEEGERLYAKGWKIENTKWDSLKVKCLNELSENQYNPDRFIISLNGQSVKFITPISSHAIERKVQLAVREFIPWGEHPHYYRIILDFNNTSTTAPLVSEVRNNITPAAPPPAPLNNQSPMPTRPAAIIDFPDVQASFPGGNSALKNWIKENLEYPKISRELGDEGTVYVLFVVETDGSITGVDVHRRGVTTELNKEAKRIIKSMPNWTAGEVKGKKVRTRCRVPVRFLLSEH